MSCGQKAVYDDENDWYTFLNKYNLKDTNWGVYSLEANLAKDYVRSVEGKKDPILLKSELIKLEVAIKREDMDLRNKHTNARNDLYKALKLLESYK